MSEQPNQPQQNEQGAVRFIFEYDGDEVRLVSQQSVDVAVTGFDLHTRRHPGHYLEMRGSGGDALAAVPVRDGLVGSLEVFPETHGEPITRVDDERPHGAFTVVVPAPSGAAEVALVRVARAEPAGAGGPTAAAGEPELTATDLATFPVRPAQAQG